MVFLTQYNALVKDTLFFNIQLKNRKTYKSENMIVKLTFRPQNLLTTSPNGITFRLAADCEVRRSSFLKHRHKSTFVFSPLSTANGKRFDLTILITDKQSLIKY